MAPEVGHMTADELLLYANEPYRTELIAGRLHEMEPPGANHSIISAHVVRLLNTHVHDAGLGYVFDGEGGFRLASDPDTVLAPDASFVARERAEAIGRPDGFWPGPPDLAIEVISPSDRRPAVLAKVRDWLDAGALVVVVLDPKAATAAVHRTGEDVVALSGEERLRIDELVPGWAPTVAELFA